MRVNKFLPSEAVGREMRIVLYDRKALLIEQHKGIVSYGKQQICVRLKEGYLKISGEGFCISEYSKDDLSLSGIIKSMEFLP